MKSQIKIFEANQNDGIFSKNHKFYPENYTDDDIYESIKNDRIKLGNKYGFSGLKMFEVEQKMEDNGIYVDNRYVIIDEKYMTKDDFFKEKIKADILMITNKYKNIVLCHRMADCPIIIAEDRKKGATAIAHCGIYHINRELPRELIKSLIKAYNSNYSDIYLYIGSCIKKESYIYDRYPEKLNNSKVWKDAIIEENGNYHIDMVKAIENQIQDFNLAEIKVSPINTATDPNYASHREAELGNLAKKGQNLVGFFYF